MMRILALYARPIGILLLTIPVIAAIPEQTRTAIDHLMGRKGFYVPDEGVYKIIIPREDATVVQDFQTFSPNLGLNSWVAFAPGVHHEAVLAGQFLLLDDEVNPVLDVVLEAGLDATGLATSCFFQAPHLHTIDVTGIGTFPTLASAFRKGLDAIKRIRRTAAVSSKQSALPTIPIESSINPAPLDLVLSMKGTVTAGVYRAAIGTRALLDGELIGREMGMSTWISIAGRNDYAFAQGEFIESPDGLRKLLRALRAKRLNVVSIRNHTLGEHPQAVFVRFWGEGTALQLARAVRYALDVQVGAVSAGSGEKI